MAQAAPAHEIFRQLSQWLALQTGFGLCYLFADDEAGIAWLQHRLAEHTQSDQSLSMRVISPSIHTTAGDVLLDMLGKIPSGAEIVWVNANADTHWQTNWLLRLNEQRQRLIASEGIFILVLPVDAQSQAAQIAPDLWAIRSLVYSTKAKQTPLSQAALEWLQPVSSTLKGDAIEPNKTPSAVKAWQTMYSHWLLGVDEKKQLSITIGLRATEQRKQQRDFDGALRIAQQTLEVAEHQYRETQAPRQKKHLLNLDRANALISLGDLQTRLGLTQAAQALYERAINLFEKEQDKAGLASTWTELALLWRNQPQQINKSIEATQKAMDYASQSGYQEVLEYCKSRLG